MSVSDMDKNQLVAHMKASREINQFDEESESWKRAFKLYKQTGNPADMECTKCRMMVREWLLNNES